MANTINGISFWDYGLKIINHENLFNMPNRIGNSFYDWGSEVQPLIQGDDIFWNTNLIKIKCLFDGRFGHDLETSLNRLRKLHDVTIELNSYTDGVSFGTFYGVMKSITDVVNKDDFAFLTLIISEDVAQFPETLPFKITGGVFNIDGYNIAKNFGILVSEAKYINDVPQYQITNKTVYKLPKVFSQVRKWGRLNATCFILYEEWEKLKLFRKMLSTEGLKKLQYRGFTYDCFLSQGFAVQVTKGWLTFNLQLNISIRESSIKVYGNSSLIPYNDLTPDTDNNTDFGNYDIRSGTLTRTFTIRNTGLSDISIGTLTIDGDSSFNITQPSGVSLGAGQQTTFTISYNPSEVGVFGATIRIPNSDELYNPYIFRVGGRSWDSSLIGVLNILGNGVLIGDGDTTPQQGDGTDFGDVMLTGSKTFGFKLKNVGTQSLNLISISVSGSVFTIIPINITSLFVDNTVTLNIICQPQAEVVTTETVTIIWNNGRDANTSYTFAVRATGVPYVSPQKVMVQYDTVPLVEIPTESGANTNYGTEFGSVQVGQSIKRNFIADALTTEPIIKSYMVLNGDFTFTPNIQLPAEYGTSQNFSISFSPTLEGSHVGWVYIETETSVFRMGISGTGLPLPDNDEIRVEGNGLSIPLSGNYVQMRDGTDFGGVPDGVFLDQEFSIVNIGNTTLIITSNAIHTIDPHFTVSEQPTTGNLAPNETTTFKIRFTADNLCENSSGCQGGMNFHADNNNGNGGVAFDINLKGTTNDII